MREVTEMLRDILTRLENIDQKMNDKLTKLEEKMDSQKGDSLASQGS